MIHRISVRFCRCFVLLCVGAPLVTSLSNCAKSGKESSTQLQYVSEIQDGRSVNSMAFSPDGQLLACGGGELTKSGEVKLWNTQTGTLLRTLAGHSDSVNSVAFSGDGKLVASGSGINVISSSDSVVTLSGTVSELKLWDAANGQLLHNLNPQGGVSAVALSVDGKALASGGGDKSVSLWDIQSGQLKQKLIGHEGVITAIVFSPDGMTLASGSTDLTVKLWNSQTGELLRTLKDHQFLVTSVAFSPDGKTLATGSASVHAMGGPISGRTRLWNVETGTLTRASTEMANLVTSVSFSPDGTTLVSSTRAGWIYFDNAETGETTRLETPEGSNFRDAKTGQARTIPPEGGARSYEVNAIAFSPDGKVLAAARSDKIIKFFKTSPL